MVRTRKEGQRSSRPEWTSVLRTTDSTSPPEGEPHRTADSNRAQEAEAHSQRTKSLGGDEVDSLASRFRPLGDPHAGIGLASKPDTTRWMGDSWTR
jgi:hypothetical protein